MHVALVTLAIVGWVASAAGAILQNQSVDLLRQDPDGLYVVPENRAKRRAVGLVLVLAGATLGLAGTVLSIV